MNILIPHSWLLEYVETEAAPEEIQKQVSLCGPSIERIYNLEGEPVYDIEVTTNRVDMMSVRGIAREVAVILNQFQVAAKFKPSEITKIKAATSTASLPLPTIINDPQLCGRIMCVVLSNLQHTPTPEWMAQRLRQIGQNIHDSVIDITNYITHELGHPCHAFDYDKIMALGGEIKVTTAKTGQPFETLDGVKYKTVGGEVVFENAEGTIIDLPAIKGTSNTAVGDGTKNVLLWIESLDPKKVRFASMTHAIRTVAAQLNEKNVDPELMPEVLARGVQLYSELCQAKVASQVYDEYPRPRTISPVTVGLSTIRDYLGVDISPKQITAMLTSLGCQMDIASDQLTVQPPSFRPDLVIPADIVEEIARIYGYHRLPSVIMPTAIPLTKPPTNNYTVEDRIKHFLADIGWQEVYTYSMVSSALAEQSGYALDSHLKIQNYLTDDRIYLRRTLVPSLVEILTQNPQQPQLAVFELAMTYELQKADLPVQELQLSLVTRGSYQQLRGAVESLLDQFFVTGVVVVPHPQPAAGFHTSATLQASSDQETVSLGIIGVTISGQAAATIGINQLLLVAHQHPRYQPIPKTTPIIEDLTFTVPAKTPIGPLMETIKAVSPLIQHVTLSDQFQQNYTFTITYHDRQQNLSDADVLPLRKKVVSQVSQQHQAELVGTV